MGKKYLDKDVYEAARERTYRAFEDFDRVYVSYSAGKDSTVQTHIAADIARELGRKFGLLLIDLEGQYKLTIDHAMEMFAEYEDVIEPYWVALPMVLRNAVSVYEPRWKCFDPERKDIWIREPPEFAITDPNFFPFFRDGMEFEEFIIEFGDWYSQGKKTACLVGIRTDESLNRYRTITSKTKETHQGLCYTTKVTDLVYNFYPIYDWKTQDIWTYHGKNPDKTYNKLYDRMAQAGLSIHSMRICQPYGDDQRRGLWLFHVIEPETWAKVVARVNGANGGSLYVQEWGNINGYRGITKPEGHTWQSFAEMLLNSLPDHMKVHYENKIFLFCRWWEERGYPDGIPDEADYKEEVNKRAPSWRRVCKSLLRNDYWLKGLSFTQTKSDNYDKYLELMERRKEQWASSNG